MYFEELIQRSYLKAEPPNDDEVVLLMAGCQSQIDQNLVVSKSDFDEILMANRAKDPTSEAILMTIGRSNITLGDPIWNTMLQRESVVDRYAQLTNRAAAQTLDSLEGSGQEQPVPFGEESFDASGEQPVPFGEESFDASGEQPVPFGEEPLPQEGFGVGEDGLPQEGFGIGEWPPAEASDGSSVPEGFGFDPSELPPEGSMGFDPSELPPEDDGFSVSSEAPPPPGSEFGYGASLTGTDGEEVLSIPEEGFEEGQGYPPAPEEGFGLPAENGFTPDADSELGYSAYQDHDEGVYDFSEYGVQEGPDGMGRFIDMPQMHPLYDCEVSEEEAENAEDAPMPGSVVGEVEDTGTPTPESDVGYAGAEFSLPDEPGLSEEEAEALLAGAAAEGVEPAESNLPEESGGSQMYAEYGAEQGMSFDTAGQGEVPPPPAYATGYPSEGAPEFDTMYPGEGTPQERGVPFDNTYPDEPVGEDVGGAPPADWGSESELPMEGGAPQGLSPSLVSGVPSAAPTQVYDLQGYTAVAPTAESAEDFNAIDSICSSAPGAGLSGLSGLTSEATDAEIPPPGTSDEFGTPPPMEDSEIHQQGGPTMYTPPTQEEQEAPPFEDTAPTTETPPEEIQRMLDSIKSSFDLFHSVVKQYSLATVLGSENLTPTEFCDQILRDFPEFEEQYDSSLASYPQDHARAVLSLVQLLQLEAESAVHNSDFDRAEKCIAPVYKLIYT